MIKLLQKLAILWEKSRFLTLLELESDYVFFRKKDILGRDLQTLRGKLAKLRAIKNPKNETQLEIIEIEAEINETEKHKQMLKTTEEKRQDLKSQVEMYKKSLWS